MGTNAAATGEEPQVVAFEGTIEVADEEFSVVVPPGGRRG